VNLFGLLLLARDYYMILKIVFRSVQNFYGTNYYHAFRDNHPFLFPNNLANFFKGSTTNDFKGVRLLNR